MLLLLYMKKWLKKRNIKNILMVAGGVFVILVGIGFAWVSTLQLPDFQSFDQIKMANSTKIYDRTGTVLLYNVHGNINRTVISSEDMGVNIKNATVAIEDSTFYQHGGISVKAILRAVWVRIRGGQVEGGSTITQQLVKNTLLTQDRTITRKIKEWILAIKLERVKTKDEILTLYLNETPYGGTIYGVEQASKTFFGIEPKDLTLAQSAYLASIPNNPTLYSPYKNRANLDARAKLVLARMHTLKFITDTQYNQALAEKVTFLPQQPSNIAAPHFVFYIIDYLTQKYGADMVDSGGLKVITTLDYSLQQKAESIVSAQAKINTATADATNAAAVVIDPNTGQILSMVGSRNYFDTKIQGNFNVATALRQPGSSFKPIVYALAFNKGYTENTTLFDVPTEFSTACDPEGNPLPGHQKTECYTPHDFDNKTRGPMTLKNALAQSINIVAIKLLYLVGINDSINLAHTMGITSLNDPSRYGLSLVIGGAEVSLLDMTSAYGTFATEGIHHPVTGILSVTDGSGNTLESFTDNPTTVLPVNTTRMISDALSDNVARTPTFGANSALNIPGTAVKTGTTNSDKDAWTVGYTPSVVVGAWVGNNNDTAMKSGGAALAGPIWNQIMTEAMKTYPSAPFNKPDPIDPNEPAILRGFWQGGDTFITDTTSGQLATTLTPEQNKKETSITNVHTILYWIDKSNPLGPRPQNPTSDPLYNNWEYGVQKWWANNQSKYAIVTTANMPAGVDTIHTSTNKPNLSLSGITNGAILTKNDSQTITISSLGSIPLSKIDVFVNSTYVTSLKSAPATFSFTPSNIPDISTNNTLRVIGYDIYGNSGELDTSFGIQ